jgi:hypothetical protein
MVSIHSTPHPLLPPSLGLIVVWPGLLGVSCLISPPASPGSGVDGGVARRTGKHLSHSVLPTNPSCSTAAPSWADAVRNGARVWRSSQSHSTSTTADFIELFEHCMASGFQAHFSISHSAGHQNVFMHCNFSTSAPAIRHCRPYSKATNSVSPIAAPPTTASPISALPISAPQVSASVPMHPQAPTASSSCQENHESSKKTQ